MNLLYYSLHQILEDDEVRLFQSLGHKVCCLGSNSPSGSVQGFRDPIVFSEQEETFYRVLKESGGYFDFIRKSCRLTKKFLEQFDIVVVMHDTDFITDNWQLLRTKPTIWRTIGQSVDAFEDKLRPLRAQGLYIVRYSPCETSIPASIGEDAIIRFAKDAEQHRGWIGDDSRVLTFSNFYEQRYPEEARDYQKIVEGLPSILGGSGNESLPEAIGMVDAKEQQRLYSHCRAYLYASGLEIPYTLNFMEAWMTGIPVVVFAPPERRGRYFEIADLVTNEKTGFICDTVEVARQAIRRLQEDLEFARDIGQNGRAAALALFSRDTAAPKWQSVFEEIGPRCRDSDMDLDVTIPVADGYPMQSSSSGVFDALSLLRPYDIDIAKIHIGNERDGGYVLADLNLAATVVSFGVGPDVTFEIDMAQRGATVHMHDHTVDDLPTHHPRCFFTKKGICGDGQATSDLATLDYHLAAIGTDATGLTLKIDVEGHEWDVFSTVTPETLARFDQIVMEVHWLENLTDAAFRNKVSRSLTVVNQQFTLHHVHANNCALIHLVENFPVAGVLELSYVRTSKVRRLPSTQIYPCALNKANRSDIPDFPLFFFPFLPTEMENFRFKEVVDRII